MLRHLQSTQSWKLKQIFLTAWIYVFLTAWIYVFLTARRYVFLAAWIYVFLAAWIYVFLAAWIYVFQAAWIYVFLAAWIYVFPDSFQNIIKIYVTNLFLIFSSRQRWKLLLLYIYITCLSVCVKKWKNGWTDLTIILCGNSYDPR